MTFQKNPVNFSQIHKIKFEKLSVSETFSLGVSSLIFLEIKTIENNFIN